MSDFVTAIGTSMHAGFALVKLRTAYAGACLRIRRSSDNAEQDIGFDADNVFDWAAAAAFIGGGTGFVTTWYDQSGNGKNLGQATSGSQPTLDLINEWIDAFGTLNTALGFGLSGDFSATQFIEFQRLQDVYTTTVYTGGESLLTWKVRPGTTTVNVYYGSGHEYNVSGATDLSTMSLLTVRKAAGAIDANTTVYQNGNLLSVSGTPSTGTPNLTNHILRVGNGTGGMKTLIFVASALGSTERAAGEDWLMNDGWLPNPPVITTASLPNGVVGTEYDWTGLLAATGGTGSLTWTVTSGSLPTGFGTLPTNATGSGGTPTAAGTFNFTVRATDTEALYDDQALSITIEAAPTTILATDGNRYHQFQAICTVKDYNEGIGFGTIENELGDGYWAQTLYGSNTGNRMLSLSMPTLQGGSSSTTVTGPNGETVTKADYIWGLFCEQKATGKPFIITSQRNDQYYLVRFAEPNLSYDRMLTKLYSTGVKLVQARIKNSSVFQPNLMDKLTGYWDANTDFATNDWAGTDGTSAINFTKTGDVIDVASGQNSQQIKRLNNTANTGYLDYSGIAGGKVYDIIIAMKMREATFSNNAGILSDAATTAFIKGDDTTTKFQDPALTNFYYALNGVERDADDMQAPMSVWGVCHFRNTDGWSVATSLRIGMFASAYAEMDLGDVILLTTPSMQDAREAVEHLMVKYAAGT